jgi:hypothetical protein
VAGTWARAPLYEAISPQLADQRPGLDQGLDTLLQEKGIPLRPLDQEPLESLEGGTAVPPYVVPQQGLQKFLRAR